MKKTPLLYLAVVTFIVGLIIIIYQVKRMSDIQNVDNKKSYSAATLSSFEQNCARCHGKNGEGYGENPSLVDNGYKVDEIKEIIQKGLDTMPAFPNIKDPILSEIAAYVADM
jgi:mono/diheme cytochrome c family protein